MSAEYVRHAHALLDACARIHGAVTGTCDGLSDADLRDLLAWLDARIVGGWEPTFSPLRTDLARYDDAVRALGYAALDVGSHELAVRGAAPSDALDLDAVAARCVVARNACPRCDQPEWVECSCRSGAGATLGSQLRASVAREALTADAPVLVATVADLRWRLRAALDARDAQFEATVDEARASDDARALLAQVATLWAQIEVDRATMAGCSRERPSEDREWGAAQARIVDAEARLRDALRKVER